MNTPLHKAAYYGDLEMVKLLVANGSNCDAMNVYKYKPVSMAIICDQFECMEFLEKCTARDETNEYKDLKSWMKRTSEKTISFY